MPPPTKLPKSAGSFAERLHASYTSVFGHLASVFVLLLYVWVSANAFLVRIQLDASVRERA